MSMMYLWSSVYFRYNTRYCF